METNNLVSKIVFDESVPSTFDLETYPDIAVIRTTDRINYRSCRRKWDLSSHMRQNLGPKQAANPLWLGSGIHYALEDFYGPKKYASIVDAFKAYVVATKAFDPMALPPSFEELVELGIGMMDYHDTWLIGRDYMPTYIMDGIPQVEANIKIEIPKELVPNHENIRYKQIFYSFQLDRVAYDEEADALWIVEYKTAAAMATTHFQNDPQVTAYMWAAGQVYDKPILGIVYQQHKKKIPPAPRILKSGEISAAKQQATTHRLYRQALIDMYGEVKKAPSANIKMLNHLATLEGEHYDAYIRRDFVYRNEKMCQAEAKKLLMEISEMLSPDTFLYAAPDRQCGMMCSFLEPCIAMDDGSDFQSMLDDDYRVKPKSYDGWRVHLPETPTVRLRGFEEAPEIAEKPKSDEPSIKLEPIPDYSNPPTQKNK